METDITIHAKQRSLMLSKTDLEFLNALKA